MRGEPRPIERVEIAQRGFQDAAITARALFGIIAKLVDEAAASLFLADAERGAALGRFVQNFRRDPVEDCGELRALIAGGLGAAGGK